MQVQQILHTQIKIVNSASLRDAFCNEIVKLSPLELWHLDFHGSSNLRNFVLSPSTACSKLTELNLSECRLVKETRSVKRFCLCLSRPGSCHFIFLRTLISILTPLHRSLGYVLIQSESVNTIKLHKCSRLNKVRPAWYCGTQRSLHFELCFTTIPLCIVCTKTAHLTAKTPASLYMLAVY